jgi:uncharacterized protein with PQ loop repeat
MSCEAKPALDYVLGVSLCLAGALSYFPQYYSLIKSKQAKGISELSLFVLNIGSVCLVLNSLILNWYKFDCFSVCGFWLCSANLLPFFQILVGWIMVLPLYMIFLRFKIKEKKLAFINDPDQRHWLWYFGYATTYWIFIVIVLIVSLVEKYGGGGGTSSDNAAFFGIFARTLGIISAVASCLVWIPQIIKLIISRNQGSLSLVMFIVQTPGNLVIILFQAVLYQQNWSTWISYVILCAEQLVIAIMLIVFKCQRLSGSSNDAELTTPSGADEEFSLVIDEEEAIEIYTTLTDSGSSGNSSDTDYP